MSNTALCITLSKVSYTCWIFLTSSWSCFNFCLAEFSFLGDIKWKKKMKIYFNGFIERMESKNKRQNRTEKQKKQNKTKITSRNAFRNLSSHFRSIIQRKKMRRYSKSIRDRKSIFFFNKFHSSLLLLCWLYQLQSLPSLVTLFGRKGFITSRKHIRRTIKYGLLPYFFESKGVPKTNEKDWRLKYNNKISL